MDKFMEIYTVSLFGHRELYDLRRVDERLVPILKELIRTKPYVSFLIGRHGEFDSYAASVIKRVQKEVGKENNEMTLVLPYTVADLEYYENYYDNIIIPDDIVGKHPKSAITLKNKWMVEQSDLVIVNVERSKGGAFTAMKYAEKQNKVIINLFDDDSIRSVLLK